MGRGCANTWVVEQHQLKMAPIHHTISTRQSTPNQSDKNGHSIPVAAAIAPTIIEIAVFLFFCAFCLRRRSRYVATHHTTGASSSMNYFPLRRYNNNNNDGGGGGNKKRDAKWRGGWSAGVYFDTSAAAGVYVRSTSVESSDSTAFGYGTSVGA